MRQQIRFSPALADLKDCTGREAGIRLLHHVDVPDCEYGANGTFLFADCGLNQDPTAEELAAIAESSARELPVVWSVQSRLLRCCPIPQREVQSIRWSIKW